MSNESADSVASRNPSPVLDAARETFASTKELGDRALAQLDDSQLHTCLVSGGNSVAVIVRHVAGNMRSRWIDFLDSDGEKPWRNRDQEFAEPDDSREQLLADWNAGWACLFAALDPLTDADLGRTVQIRGQDLTVVRAIDRQISHYGYHIGQIVLIARTICGDRWETLSIARGRSAEYNRDLFGDSSK
jgi:uncharacterized damage-inducible protein DinB